MQKILYSNSENDRKLNVVDIINMHYALRKVFKYVHCNYIRGTGRWAKVSKSIEKE